MRERVVVSGDSVPRFAAHATFRFDETRKRWVVLAPERLLLPDDIAVEILKCCDGSKTVQAIVEELAARYETPAETVGPDVAKILQDLADKGIMEA